MRQMRSSMPIFLMVGLAFIAVIGVIILGASATSASVAVNDSTTEELAVGLYTADMAIMYGFSALLLVVAGYFALKMLI